MSKDFKAIIFDMDGLLVDSETVWFDAEAEMFTSRGFEYTAEIRESIIGLRVDEFLERLRNMYGIADPLDKLVNELNERMLTMIPSHVKPRPGAEAIIDYVLNENIPHAIASNSPMPIINAIVSTMGWDNIFDVRCSGDDEPEGKPAPHVYLTAARKIGFAPAACLGLEDSVNGARAVVAAGMTCFAVPDSSHSDASKFVDITPHVFDSLHDVINHLRDVRRV